MKRRQKLSRKASKKNFSRNALRINPRNATVTPMRGGIRL